jgi:hypothetical protein
MNLEALQAEVLRLPPADRSRLLDSLVATLHVDASLEAERDQLADKREMDLAEGTATEIPFEIAIDRLEGRFPGCAQLPRQLTDAMFLCEHIVDLVPQIRLDHQHAFALAEDLNYFANGQLFATTVKKGDRQQVVVSSLLPRLLTAFQGGLLLAERGLSAELKLLTRKVLEVTFRIAAIARDADVAEKYIQSDEMNRKKLLSKLRRLRTVTHTTEELATIDQLETEVKAAVQAAQIKELSIEWYAEKAGMSDFYNSVYAYLSQSAHANVRDLDALVERDVHGEPEAFRYGPDPDGTSDILCTAIEVVVIALDAAANILPNFDRNKIAEFHQRMEVLFSELNT